MGALSRWLGSFLTLPCSCFLGIALKGGPAEGWRPEVCPACSRKGLWNRGSECQLPPPVAGHALLQKYCPRNNPTAWDYVTGNLPATSNLLDSICTDLIPNNKAASLTT